MTDKITNNSADCSFRYDLLQDHRAALQQLTKVRRGPDTVYMLPERVRVQTERKQEAVLLAR